MSLPKISFACSLYDRMLPLYTGEVRVEGMDLEFLPVYSSRNIFDRMAGRQEFDACEFSMSEFIARQSANQCPFVAIPVFPSRTFRHGCISINASKGIRTPKDLEGRRIGIPVYTMTAAIWIRGHLQHDYGVDLSSVHWIQGAINEAGAHGEPDVLPILKPVSIEDNRTGKSLSQLLDEGEIDAIIGTNLPDSRHHNPDVRRLFTDFKQVERSYYERTGIFPIMHAVAIRKDVYERHPQAARSLYEACCASKSLAQKRMRHLGALRYMLPWMAAEIDELDTVFGSDWWPYGVDRNRKTLQTFVDYMAEQSVIASPLDVGELFVDVGSELH